MKLITAVIKPFKIDEVKDALKDAGVQGLTISEVEGFGRQSGHTEVYRGAEYKVDFVPKRKIEVLCDDADASRLAAVIESVAKTGTIGDGKLWIIDVAGVVRLRTGEHDADAL
jgi:nitrogen regulatory protein P-II 1